MIDLHTSMLMLLEQGKDFVLATILSRQGSTPRTAGTKMIVHRNGDIVGTIGGGLVEAEVMKIAKETFRSREAEIRRYDLTGAHVESMDMVCGGSLEILTEFVEASPSNSAFFQAQTEALRKGGRSYAVADLGAVDQARFTVKRCLISDSGERLGDLEPPAPLLAALSARAGKDRVPTVVEQDGRRYLVEPSFTFGVVYLFGAGHVSQQVAPLAKRVHFNIVVMDDRREFANRDRFPDADEIVVPDSYEGSLSELHINENSYLVIVTRGHAHDKTVLEQALRTDARYIGMIGSRKKRDTLYAQLMEQGFTEKDLARVCSPIGMEISAETPEEIGVSIVGELIKVRASQSK